MQSVSTHSSSRKIFKTYATFTATKSSVFGSKLMYFIKTPELLKKLYPNQVWSLPARDKSIYLTFDDGPTPGVTDWVLKTLNERDAKATFFLVGDNVKKHPDLVKTII